jgi:hypothetical protein
MFFPQHDIGNRRRASSRGWPAGGIHPSSGPEARGRGAVAPPAPPLAGVVGAWGTAGGEPTGGAGGRPREPPTPGAGRVRGGGPGAHSARTVSAGRPTRLHANEGLRATGPPTAGLPSTTAASLDLALLPGKRDEAVSAASGGRGFRRSSLSTPAGGRGASAQSDGLRGEL